MNLKTFEYNNNLLYLSAMEGNKELLSQLLEKGYPKSIKDIPKKVKKTTTPEELLKISKSYNNATYVLIKNLIETHKNISTLNICLKAFVRENKFLSIKLHHQILGGLAFYHGNLKAFELLCEVLGKEEMCTNTNLLWYIHQAKRNRLLSKRRKEILTEYLEKIGINWSEAKFCLVRWANIHRDLEDFKYFYNNRKKSLKNNPSKQKIIKRELSNCIERFLISAMDIENNIQKSALEYIATRSEFTKKNPYEGYLTIIRKSYRIASYMQLNTYFIEEYIHLLIKKEPNIINYFTKSNVRVPQLFSFIEKINLHKKLSMTLKQLPKKETIKKI